MKELVTNKGQGSLTPLKAFSCFHTDVFSDFTLARQGYPRMAFSACFGGIIFSILSAVALPSVLGAKGGLSIPPPRDGLSQERLEQVTWLLGPQLFHL